MYEVHRRRVTGDVHVISGCVVFEERFADADEPPAWYEAGQDVHSPFNAYVVDGERTLLYDTLPHNMVEEVHAEVDAILDGRDLDVIVVSHPEAPHGGNAPALLETYPDAELVLPSAGSMHDLHVGADEDAFRTVAHRERLDLGDHLVEFHDPLLFDLAATVWMYEETTGTLFTSDAYGYPHLERECGMFAEELTDDPDHVIDRWANFHTTAIPWIEYYDPEKYAVLAENLIEKYDVRTLAPAHGAPATEGADAYLRGLERSIRTFNETAGEYRGDTQWLL